MFGQSHEPNSNSKRVVLSTMLTNELAIKFKAKYNSGDLQFRNLVKNYFIKELGYSESEIPNLINQLESNSQVFHSVLLALFWSSHHKFENLVSTFKSFGISDSSSNVISKYTFDLVKRSAD